MTGQDVVNEARKYMDTPFQHQGRCPGAGLDCVGVITCTAQALNITDHDVKSYPRDPSGFELIKELEKTLIRVPLDKIQDGDILVFWIDRETKEPQHLAFKTDKGMLHTFMTIGFVTEHGLDKKWKRRLSDVFRFPGVK